MSRDINSSTSFSEFRQIIHISLTALRKYFINEEKVRIIYCLGYKFCLTLLEET